MADSERVNPQVLDTISVVQGATMVNGVVKTSGAGKAYQSVAQSSAMAVQDATDYLRNMGTMSTTAVGAAMAQLLADPQEFVLYKEVLNEAQGLVTRAAHNFKTIGEDAAEVLAKFSPTG